MACIVEAHHDEKGIAWPDEVAPYAAHLVAIGARARSRVPETAERLHALAKEAGREILYDDRDESPGVKFTDAELLGMPWILTVTPRSLAAGGVEVTRRATGERSHAVRSRTVEGFLRDGFAIRAPEPGSPPRPSPSSASSSSRSASWTAVPSSPTIVSAITASASTRRRRRLLEEGARVQQLEVRVVDPLDRELDARRERCTDRDLADSVGRAAVLEARVGLLLEGRRLDDDVGEDPRVDALEGGREARASPS